MLESTIEIIYRFIDNNIILTHVLFFISSFLQMTFPPHPGDFLLIFLGYLSVRHEQIMFLPSFIIAFLGTMTGSSSIFFLGYYKGEKVLNFRFVKRFLTEKKVEKSRKTFDKYGVYTLAICKFIPGISSASMLIAGTFKMRYRAFVTWVAISTLIHHLIFIGAGRFFCKNQKQIKIFLATYNFVAISVFIIFIICFILYRRYFLKRKRVE